MLLISTFKYQSFPPFINGAVSPSAVISVATSPLRITLLPFATSIGIDRVGSVPSRTLNFTWAVPLIGGTCSAYQRRTLLIHHHCVIDCICQRSSRRMRSPWRHQSFVSQDALYILCGPVVSMDLQFRRTALRYLVRNQETCQQPCVMS